MNAVVTGAGRGLGLELAKQLIGRGYRVFGTVRSSSDALEQLGATPLKLDVADTASIEVFAARVAEIGAIDVLVNNAGINSRGVPEGQGNVRWGQLEPEGLLRMARVNAIGPLLVTQALDPVLKQGSRVLSVTSWLGSIGEKTGGGNYGYCSSKAMLNMLGHTMSLDLAKRGVISILANPGWVQTDMGGSRASLTPEQSVRGLLDVLHAATLEDAGRFLQWDGTEHAW